jgi:hypothetical protein
MSGALDTAKRVLADDEAVLYGIFGVIGCSGYFPPRAFLNEFLKWGSDPCDQDGRISSWVPFALSPDEYNEVKAWWVAGHTGAIEDSLSAESWNDWVQEMLDRIGGMPES